MNHIIWWILVAAQKSMVNRIVVFKEVGLMIINGWRTAPLEIRYTASVAKEKIEMEVLGLAQNLRMVLLQQVSITGKKDVRKSKSTKKPCP